MRDFGDSAFLKYQESSIAKSVAQRFASAKRPVGSGGWAGVDKVWEQDSVEA